MSVQLPLGELPLDPRQVAELPILERAKLYADLDLAPEQREAAEEAVRLIVARRYGRRGRG